MSSLSMPIAGIINYEKNPREYHSRTMVFIQGGGEKQVPSHMIQGR